jgi:hypothetical protein
LLALKEIGETGRLARLQAIGVRFNNQTVNKAMLMAVNAFDGKIDKHGREVLHSIERLHGRDVMTSGYYKLMRIVQLCVKEADYGQIQEPVSFFVNFCLDYLECALRFSFVHAKEVTAYWLDKGKDGTPDMIPMTLAKVYITAFVQSLVEDLAQTHPGLQAVKDLQVLKHFTGYPMYEHSFPLVRAERGTGDSHNEEGGEGGEAADPVEAGVAAIDFFYDLFGGMYDGALRDAIKVEPALSKINWQEVANFDGFKELARQLHIHKVVVNADVDGDGPPAPTSRTLKRYGSDKAPDHWVWWQAQQTRRKIITVPICRFSTTKTIDDDRAAGGQAEL